MGIDDCVRSQFESRHGPSKSGGADLFVGFKLASMLLKLRNVQTMRNIEGESSSVLARW